MKNNLTKELIIEEIKKREFEIKEKFNVKHLFLFGSYASGKQKESSDIDILVEFNGKYDFFNELDFQTYLYNIFKIDVGVIEKDHIAPNYKEYILNLHNKIEIC